MNSIDSRTVPTFPLSSPPTEQLTSFKPSNAQPVHSSGNPFLHTNTFASSSSDDDSGCSSGRDEFQLERYSQSSTTTRPSQRARRKQSIRDKSRKRPGLNIVTNFSNSAKRTHTDGLLIDQVQAQRPRMKPRYATSVVSAKAEHGHHLPHDNSRSSRHHDGASSSNQELPLGKTDKMENSKRALGREALSRLQALQAARKKTPREPDHAQHEILRPNESLINSRQTGQLQPTQDAHSPDKRSIVIGLSVPEAEAEAHKLNSGGDSALSMYTPDTPAIIVTPAEDADTWVTKPTSSKNRPVSSVYSTTPWGENTASHNDTPPVPKLPSSLSRKQVTNHGSGHLILTHRNPQDLEKYGNQVFYDERDVNDVEHMRRASSESKEHILGSRSESARHKSQGWWNLMLSPMLSRKGTLKSIATLDHDHATPPIPSMPSFVHSPKGTVISPTSSQSPGTPRRHGLASARASVWSRWTTWEKARDADAVANEKLESPSRSASFEKEQVGDDSKEVTSGFLPYSGKGLAADYYHACAVEQAKGIRYFECENHSCEEQLPKLHSIFDSRVLLGATLNGHNEDRSTSENQADSSNDTAMVKRALSNITIGTEPEELSPNVRQANTAAVVQAKSIDSFAKHHDGQEMANRGLVEDAAKVTNTDTENKTARLVSSASRRDVDFPNIATIVPGSSVSPAVPSPGPVSPGMQKTMASQGAVPMADIVAPPAQTIRPPEQTLAMTEPTTWDPTQPHSLTIHNHTTYTERAAPAPLPVASQMERREEPPSRPVLVIDTGSRNPLPISNIKEEDSNPEPHDAKSKKKSLLSRINCFGRKKKPADTNEAPKSKQRYWKWIIGIVLFLIVVACVLTAMLVTRAGDGTPVQSQWLNLTGYPPMPTGISTIARPDVKQQSQCVAPATLWSCALPKESHGDVLPNSPDQPNFRFQITFKNGTVPVNMTIPVDELSKRSLDLGARGVSDLFSDDLFEPDPAPPSRADQLFMGNTTDNITQPFDGEKTPFFITFVPAFPIDPNNTTNSASASVTSSLARRQENNSTDSIPAPDVLNDGSAAPANLLPIDPYPSSQPIKLYNRGLPDEHYGFYMYYDKSIFLRSRAPFNGSSTAADSNGIDPTDTNGGSTRNEAQFRCTFSQTRFLVRMWTNPAFGATLLPPLTETDGSTGTDREKVNSATDFSRPGSFPYPTTITLDRHGGNVNKKTAYCYGVDELQVIQVDVKTLIPEARGVGGVLINAAPRLVNGTGLDTGFDQTAGGIDGGTGGCNCIWQNWN
ncbi:hypothetical protein LTR84_010665 [Exophiala bonariae]|uniref:Glycoprotease family protein n=1 Tax=Exophiala bonariae TaxID=1690606 RepID=A0AAV9MW24_9EURO|nr:hypothetical protein LTR84_010665 [Exophiala bonariae]